jgi:hypothetical protein
LKVVVGILYQILYIFVPVNTMKSVELSRGQVAIVDDEVFDAVSQWKWHINSEGYVISNLRRLRHSGKPGLLVKIYLHRWVLESFYNIRAGGLQIDHINGDKTGNRLVNLRIVTNQQNQFNAKRRSTNTSGYKGVSYDKKLKKYRAYITINGKLLRLGDYLTAQEAANAYNAAAIEYHSEYARLNKFS